MRGLIWMVGSVLYLMLGIAIFLFRFQWEEVELDHNWVGGLFIGAGLVIFILGWPPRNKGG